MILRAFRLAADYLPRHAGAAVARRLVARANAARDNRRWAVAAALYEEALRFAPGNPRIHVQCGHMLKEAGDLAGAEAQYREAERLMPDDADLALQLGHFYKIAAQDDRAEEAYRRALVLRPGWADAKEELGRLGARAPSGADDADLDWAIPELLPRSRDAPEVRVDSIQLRRLGASGTRGRTGTMRLLRGVEAIRGYALSSAPLKELSLQLDGQELRRVALAPFPATGEGAQRKYVFNLWHDFSAAPLGRHQIELVFVGEHGRKRVRREQVLIEAPISEAEFPDSDAVVDAAPGDDRPVEAQLADRPSMIRSVERRLLPRSVGSILVQRVDQLGDLVVSLPAIRRLRELFPEARLVGLLTAANADLGRALGLFDEIIVARFAEDPVERRRTMTLEEQARLRRALEPYRFDLAIDLSEVSDSRPLLLLSGATFLHGFKEREFPWLSAGLEMNARDPVNGIDLLPPSRKILALVEALGPMRASPAQVTPREGLDRSALTPYGIAAGQPYVVLHTGARLAYTRWPGFGELARLLLERTTLKVVILADEETADLPPTSERLVILKGALPFDDFDALLSFAAAFVGNDSGAKHLAALRGTPVVSLHMARLNWSEWGQEMSGLIVSHRVPCAGCGIGHNAEECGKDFACLKWIRPDEIFDAVLSLL